MALIFDGKNAQKDIVDARTQVWRKSGANYDLVGESQAFTLKKGIATIQHEILLDTPITVKTGDFFGFYSGQQDECLAISNICKCLDI